MAIYSSGSIHFSGLNSDLDVDTLITDLYKIESKYAEKLISWRDDWQTRLEAFQQIRSQLLSMQSTLQSMNSVDKFLVKNANSSNSAVTGATVTGEAAEGVYTIAVNQLATNAIWSMDTGLSSKTDIINDSGNTGYFTYTYKGTQRTVSVPSGTTLEGLKNLINNDSQNPGVKVQLIESAGGVVFQLRGNDTGQSATLSIDSVSDIDLLALETEDVWTATGTNQLTSNSTYSSTADVVNTTQTAKTFVFSVNGQETSVSLAAGATLLDLHDAINATTSTSGVTADFTTEVVGGETVYRLRLSTAATGDVLSVSGGSLAAYSGMTESTNWYVQKAQNAEMRINGWPGTGWLEQESNSVTGVADGITFSLRSVGESVVTVEIDTQAIAEKIEQFVAEVNTFRTLLQSLTTVDSEKSTLDPEYAESQYEMQSGSVLTGNYGVQMLASMMKSLLGAQAVGFSYQKTENGTTTGDVFSSLSQLGITTDANQGSSTYGLLVINEISGLYGSLTLTEALAQDPVAVAKLFAAKSEAVTNSSYFGYNSHVAGITQAGTFAVEYSVDSLGNITNAWINGKEAAIDQANRQIGIYSSTSPSNVADGLVLDIYDLTPGGTFTGEISIRNGKVNELLALMDGSEGWLGEQGTLKILENNYQTVIKNIETKIQKEDERLAKWETTMRAKFSRLETVLSNYKNINSSLETLIEQLSSSK